MNWNRRYSERALDYYVFLNAPEVFVEHTTKKGLWINTVTHNRWKF